MNPSAYNSLLASLNNAIDILDHNRTSDPALIAAFDTLKQARARVVRAVEHPDHAVIEEYAELAAA